MKNFALTLLILSMLILVPSMPSPVAAATGGNTGNGFELGDFRPCPRGTFRVRRHTRTKKKVVNSLIAGGVGAAIGGGIGGKRGALIGAGSGAGGYLLYRYIRDKRGRCVVRYVRR